MKKAFIAGFLFLSILFVSAPNARAATVAELQAQISALLAQIAALQAQLGQSTGGTATSPTTASGKFCYTFIRNLKFGDGKNSFDEPMVSALQTALEKEGFVISLDEKKAGSVFGKSTEAAVTGFQEKYADEILSPNGLTNGNGFVGVSTRIKLNALYGCSGPTPSPTTKGPVEIKLRVGDYTSTGYQEPTVNLGKVDAVMFTWDTKNAASCNTYGQTKLRLSDGTYWNTQNLPTSGSRTFYTINQKDGYGTDTSNTTIGVQCYGQGDTGLGVSRGINVSWTPVTPTKSSDSVPVDLKVVSNVTGNTGSLVSASIAGYPTNNNVSYWKLTISCEDGVTVSNYSGTNICGTENTYSKYNIFNPSSDYTMITSFGLKNVSSWSKNIVLALVAYDANGNNIGADKEGIILGYSAPQTMIVGDVNGDGSITCADATMISEYSVGLIKLTVEQKSRADVNGDGFVNIIDAQQIVRNNNLSCSSATTPTIGTPAPTTYLNNASDQKNSVTVTSGSSVNFIWGATNFTKCQMFKNGALFNDGVYNSYGVNVSSYSGTFYVPNQTQNATYTLTCTGAGGSQSGSVAVSISGQATTPTPAPSTSVNDPYSANYSQTSTIPLSSSEKTVSYTYPSNPCGGLMTDYINPGSVYVGNGPVYASASTACSPATPNTTTFRVYSCRNNASLQGQATFAFQCNAVTSSLNIVEPNYASVYESLRGLLQQLSGQLVN